MFNYLDYDGEKSISFSEFKLLSEENWRKMDPVDRYVRIMKNRLKEAEDHARQKESSITINTTPMKVNQTVYVENSESPFNAYGNND